MTREWVEQRYWAMSGGRDAAETDKGCFDRYYERFANVLEDEIAGWCKERKEPVPELSGELRGAFLYQLQQITLRTLIFEMQVSERCGELKGRTEQEKYLCYAEGFLQDEDYLHGLYTDYPVMYDCAFGLLKNTACNLEEVLRRFRDDRDELNSFFFRENPCRDIRRIGGGESDSHNGGHRVYILELDNGKKLVYKPRSVKADVAYGAFLQWVAGNVDIPYWWNRMLDRESYGWCEWVEAETCENRKQLETYYLRNGILLCVSYVLGSEDMHYENLIAHGEYPVIVDLEMGLGSRGCRAMKGGWTETERVYYESVLQTGILPLYTWNDAGEGVNVGAINGNGGQLLPLFTPVIVQAGTVSMHIEYRQPVMGEGKNLATWNGTFIEPYIFLEKIEEGFERAYHFLMSHKEAAQGKLDAFLNAPVRYLVRDTQQYAMLLAASYAPDFMMDEEEREKFLFHVEYDPARVSAEELTCVTQYEVKALKEGDIPYFWYHAGKTELYSGEEKVKNQIFPLSPVRCAEKRLLQMKQSDLLRQKKMIASALLMGTKTLAGRKEAGQGKKKTGKSCPESELSPMAGTDVARRIGDILLDEAIWSEDRREAGWISMLMAGYGEQSYLIRPMNLYLYDGLAGAAVFMTALADAVKEEKYREVSEILIDQLFTHTEELRDIDDVRKFPTGAFSGEASIAYAYLLLYSIRKEKVFLEYLYRQCQETARMTSCDSQYDLLGGNAGAILVFLRAYEATGEGQYVYWAKEAGEHLIQSGTAYPWGLGWVNPLAKTALTGFAHGASGMMLALAKLGYVTKDERFSAAAHRAYEFEQYFYDAKRHDWKDLRYPEKEKTEGNSAAWCHGRGGIIMARLAAVRYVDEDFRKELERSILPAADCLETVSGENEYCLCHGRCGQAALLYYAGRKDEGERARRKIIERLYCCGDKIQESLFLQECENYGLLGGIAGIGYSCLVGNEKVSKLLCCEEGRDRE